MVTIRTTPIRVYIIDDALLLREILIQQICAQREIEVIGIGKNCFHTLDEIKQTDPDIIIINFVSIATDDHILMDQLFMRHPIPIIIVGAPHYIDFKSIAPLARINKPSTFSNQEIQRFILSLLSEIHRLDGQVFEPLALKKNTQSTSHLQGLLMHKQHIIALGASTGGTNATFQVISKLPADFPAILIVQHMPPGVTKQYAQRLNCACQMHVLEASDGDRVCNGEIYIAPGNHHLRLAKDINGYYIQVDKGKKVSGHRPSADALFESVAAYAPTNSTGIILTGMGADGAHGLLQMRKNGAFTIGQDEASCVIYGMPKVAYELGAVCEQAPIQKISEVLTRHIENL